LSNSQTVAIYDNDLPTLTVAATDATLTETLGNPGVFTITRTGGNPYQSLTVDYALAGRAVHGVDYRRLDGRATIPAGATSTTVEIYPFDDSVDEGTQDVILQLRSTTTYAIGGTGTATMSITDNDGPQVYVKLTTSGVIEPATGSVTDFWNDSGTISTRPPILTTRMTRTISSAWLRSIMSWVSFMGVVP